jgi:peptidyl-prolyl cis-trans isomerase SurA
MAPQPAQAVVIEKVVAVVGEKPILLTDLRKRARPFLLQLYRKVPTGPQRAAAESKLLSQLLERMVDEELEALSAMRSNTVVSSEDVDKALKNMAAMGRVTLSQLFEDVRRNSGMSEQEYRREIRRQVLEGKLLQRLVQDRFRITDADLQRMFERTLQQELAVRQYNPAWIVVRIGEGASAAVARQKRELASDLVRRARGGEDFGDLARQHSDDAGSREAGGDLGIRAPGASPAALSRKRPTLAPELEKEVMKLAEGEISEPIPFKDALVIFKLISRQPSRYTSLENARPEMIQRVKAEQLEKAKVKWLKDLRRRNHVDIRQ